MSDQFTEGDVGETIETKEQREIRILNSRLLNMEVLVIQIKHALDEYFRKAGR